MFAGKGFSDWLVDLAGAITGTLGVAQGGTGLTALGTAGQVLRVNSGASALEYGTVSSTVPIGHLSGLTVSRKDNDEIYVSGGSIEIEEVLYNSGAQLAVSPASAPAASTPYYVYADPPASGTELAVANLIISGTAPSFDSAKGGWYHPTNTDQRAICTFTTDGDGHVPTSGFVIYSPVQSVPVQSTIGISIDGGGSAIEAGVKGYVTIPYDCTITGWHLTGSPSGSIVIDVWKDAGAIPTVANTIAGTERPTLSSAQVASDADLTTWTTAVSAGDVIGFNVDSCSLVEQATLVLSITK